MLIYAVSFSLYIVRRHSPSLSPVINLWKVPAITSGPSLTFLSVLWLLNSSSLASVAQPSASS